MLIPLTVAKRADAFVTTKGVLIGYTMLQLSENTLCWGLVRFQA